MDQIPSLYSQYLLPTLREISFWLEELLSGADPQVLTALEEMQTQLFSMLGQLVSSVSVWLTTWVSSTAVSLPGLFIRLLLMVISTFFFTIDYEKITQFVLNALHGHTREIVLQVKNYVVGTLFVCIWSYALIMFITFTELSIGLWVIGVERSTLIAALIAVFDILPVLGTGGIMIPWAILSLLGGELTRGLSLLVLYLIITVIRNIIEPKIVGKQIGLHPVLTLMSMYVGTNLFGVVGLFGLPILLSLLRYLNEKGTISLYPVPGKTPPAQESPGGPESSPSGKS